MEKELKPKVSTKASVEEVKVDPSKIKQEYAKMQEAAAAQQPLTEEQITAHMLLQEKVLDERLPYMRKQAEFSELEVKCAEFDLKMQEFRWRTGQVNPQNIPGPLGLDFQMKQINLQNNWAKMRLDSGELLEATKQAKTELDELQKAITEAKKTLGILKGEVAEAKGEKLPDTGDITVEFLKDYITAAGTVKAGQTVIAPHTGEFEFTSGETKQKVNLLDLKADGIVKIIK